MCFSFLVWGSMVFKDNYCNFVDLFVDAPKTFLSNIYIFLFSFLSKCVFIFVIIFVKIGTYFCRHFCRIFCRLTSLLAMRTSKGTEVVKGPWFFAMCHSWKLKFKKMLSFFVVFAPFWSVVKAGCEKTKRSYETSQIWLKRV